MSTQPPRPQARGLAAGDRVQIQQGYRAIPDRLGWTGTIVEVFRVPRDSCLVRIDGDQDKRREWFFYDDEIVVSEA